MTRLTDSLDPAYDALDEQEKVAREMKAKEGEVMGHTPGPWEAVLEDGPRPQPVPYYRGLIALIHHSSEIDHLSVVTSGDRLVPKTDWEANATLIAAAPDMAETLERAFSALITMVSNAYTVGLEGTSEWDQVAGAADIHGTIDEIRVTLKKAKPNV